MKAIIRIKEFIQAGHATEELLQDIAAIEGLYHAAKALYIDLSDAGQDTTEAGNEYSIFTALRLALREINRSSSKTFNVSLQITSELSEHEVAELVGRALNDTDGLSEACVFEAEETE